MESIFINKIENTTAKELVKKIITLFNELHLSDSKTVGLLIDYLIGHFGKGSVSTSCKYSQTEPNDQPPHNGWDMKDISNEVKQVAEQCMNQTGLNYDRTSGTYYNSEEGYYYIPDYRLYYYPQLSAYYYYDETSDSLKFHSSVNTSEGSSDSAAKAMVTEPSSTSSKSNKRGNDEPVREKENHRYAKVCNRKRITNEDKEEGELSSTDEELEGGSEEVVEDCNATRVIFESGPKAFAPDHTKHNAPCMRMVVVKTSLDDYTAGTLFLVTRDGGTLGREGTHHSILLPDSNISKDHLRFHYVYKGDTEQRYAYEVIDLGSRNGTWVNGKRLSNSNEISRPEEISHGSVLTVGNTTLLCHIHKDMDSCSECQTVEIPLLKESTTVTMESNLTSKQQHQLQMMQMKQKYQLDSRLSDDGNKLMPQGYTDRAKARRETVGSSHHSEKTETASVYTPMNKTNKGYDLLSKMGWKEGNTLGKNASSTSIQEPLYVEPKIDKAGFGS